MQYFTGTRTHPIRVAIIGSGPSAFYAAEFLLSAPDAVVEVDMFERLPTPFGLVRGGVAPDHPKIKTVTRAFERTAQHERFRFFGNVTFGRDLTHDDIAAHYHAVIYATGAQTDRRLGIPGEDLPNSHAATEFVAWYNSHPDYAHLSFDLSQERVAVIGNGNVAVDVARILARTPDELRQTDIADYALEALAQSRVREILILGRRGPAQAKFTSLELKELGSLTGADIFIEPQELELDPLSAEYLRSGESRTAVRNYEIFQEFARSRPLEKPRRITMRFLLSPVEFLGTDRIEAIRMVRNEICERGHFMSPCPTEEYETIPVGLVFRSIGYQGVPLPGVPFDDQQSIIPNKRGRVINEHGERMRGEYAVGWIKRGAVGIIGSNKPDAQETVEYLLRDMAFHQHFCPANLAREAIPDLLQQRGIRYVTYEDWRLLDRLEIERGEAVGRPRVKFTSVAEMLNALETARQAAAL